MTRDNNNDQAITLRQINYISHFWLVWACVVQARLCVTADLCVCVCSRTLNINDH